MKNHEINKKENREINKKNKEKSISIRERKKSIN